MTDTPTPKVVELLRLRYRCRQCGDVIETKSGFVKCRCGAIGVDGEIGDPNNRIRMLGNRDDFISLCEWRLESGGVLREQDLQAP